jgi:hypothetical protein
MKGSCLCGAVRYEVTGTSTAFERARRYANNGLTPVSWRGESLGSGSLALRHVILRFRGILWFGPRRSHSSVPTRALTRLPRAAAVNDGRFQSATPSLIDRIPSPIDYEHRHHAKPAAGRRQPTAAKRSDPASRRKSC